MKFFGAVRQKKFERKLWYSLHPHMSTNFVDTWSFVKRSRVSPTKCFGTARQKKSTEDRDVTPFIINFFDTLSLWNTKGFPCKNFRHYETTNFRRKKLDMLPSSYPYTLSLTEVSWNTAEKGSSTNTFSVLRDKKIRQKIVT